MGCHVVAGNVFHYRSAADGIRQFAHIRAAGVACRQPTHRVVVACNVEIQGYKARRALCCAVIDVAGIAVRHHGDLVLVGTVVDGQFACGLRSQGVVGGYIVVGGVHHFEAVGGVVAVVVSVHQRAVRRSVGDCRRLTFHHVIEGVCGITALDAAVILNRLVCNTHRHGSRRYGQGSGFRRDDVVRRHVFLAMHHLVARRNRVCRLRHVRHAAHGLRHQRVASQQATDRNCYCAIGVCVAVVGPGLACRRDGDGYSGMRHRQLSVLFRHVVVAGRASRELVACQCIDHRALARERDAACHHCGERVVAD